MKAIPPIQRHQKNSANIRSQCKRDQNNRDYGLNETEEIEIVQISNSLIVLITSVITFIIVVSAYITLF